MQGSFTADQQMLQSEDTEFDRLAVIGLVSLADEFFNTVRKEFLDCVSPTPAVVRQSQPDQSGLVARLRFYTLHGDTDARQAQHVDFGSPDFNFTTVQVGDMRHECNRLASFEVDDRVPQRLAADLSSHGFYCLTLHSETHAGANTDQLGPIRCAFCLGEVDSWRVLKSYQSSWKMHRVLFPLCPFVLGMQVSNVPLAQSASPSRPVQCTEPHRSPAAAAQSLMYTQNGQDLPLTPDYSLALPHPTGPSYQAVAFRRCSSSFDSATRDFNPNRWRSLECQPPVKPDAANLACRLAAQFSTMDSLSGECLQTELTDCQTRLEQFQQLDCAVSGSGTMSSCWSGCVGRHTDWELANAGFVPDGDGSSDWMRCYWCGLRIRFDWRESAPPCDPWVQHARWSPACGHVLAGRGASFIQLVLSSMPPFLGDPQPRQQQQQHHQAEQLLKYSEVPVQPAPTSRTPAWPSQHCSPRDIRSRADLASTRSVSRLFSDNITELLVAMETRLRLVGDDLPESAGSAALLDLAWRLRRCLPALPRDARRNQQLLLQLSLAHYVAAQTVVETGNALCQLCSTRPACVIYLPCCHTAICVQCSKSSSASSRCPICNTGLLISKLLATVK